MSPLWPEPVHIGLFPERSWFSRGREVLASWGPSDGAGLMIGCEAALAALPVLRGKGRGKARVLASDSLASIVPVPWQSSLGKQDEKRAYAVACLEAAGYALDDSWVMHVEFRHPGRMGLAYAFKRDWLMCLQQILSAGGLVLDVVLPVAACAYSRRPAVRLAGDQIVVLEERSRITAMTFDREGMVSLDIEPLAGGLEKSLPRLIARQPAGAPADYWRAVEGGGCPDLGGRPVQLLGSRHWEGVL